MADNTLKFRAILDDKVSGGLDKMRGKFDTLGKSKGFKSVAQGVGMGAGISAWGLVTGAIDGFVNKAFESIEAASAQREAMSLATQVFEKNADAVSAWAGSAAKDFGTSKRAALEFASSFGTAFKNVGMDLDETVDKSETMARLAVDLGSAFNRGSDEAATALRSGLLGESEPMRQFGVFLSEAAVQAKAAQMGIAKLGTKLTDGQKVAARYALIMEQTADSQGMFGRDTGSLADAQKRLSASFEDLEATIGTKLLPTMTDLVKLMNDEGVPAIENEITGVEKLGTGVVKTSDDIGNAIADMADSIVDDLMFWDGHTDDSIRSWQRFVASIEDAKTPTGNAMTGIGKDAKKMGDDVDGATDKVVVSFDDMVKALKGDVSTLIDQVYDPAIQHAELAATKEEAAGIRRAIASGKLTAAEVRDSKRRLLTLTKDADETRLSLLESGNLTADETKKWLDKLQKRYKTSTGDARQKIAALIAKIKELARTSSGGVNITVSEGERKTTRNKARASGGPVWPGEAYTVGEGGKKETLVMGDRGGYIYPDGGLRAGGGNVIHVNFNSTFPPTPQQARAVVPELVREMRRQHVL